MNLIPRKPRKATHSRVSAAPPPGVPDEPSTGVPTAPASGLAAGTWWNASPGNSECISSSIGRHLSENFHLFGAPLSRPMMSYTTAAGCFKGTHVSTTDTTAAAGSAQMGDSEKEAIDINANDTHLTARSEVRLNWSYAEDVRLASAWVLHSVDPVDGNDRKAEQYWGDVTDTYNSTTENNRSRNRNQLKIRWDRIKKPVSEFQGCWNRINKVYQSGVSDDQLTDQALELFASEHNEKPFTLRHVWNVLRHERKWSAHVKKLLEKDNSGSPTSNPAHVVNIEDNPAQRPMGHKRAKELRNGKRKASDVSAGINEKLEKFIEASNKAREGREKLAEVQQNLADKKLEAAKLAHKTAREKTKCKMLDTYRELMFASTSHLSEEALTERGKALESMRLSLFSNDD